MSSTIGYLTWCARVHDRICSCRVWIGAGKEWVGVRLRDGKGDGDGRKDGTTFFECPYMYGVFVRETKVMLLEHWNAAMEKLETRRRHLVAVKTAKKEAAASKSPGHSASAAATQQSNSPISTRRTMTSSKTPTSSGKKSAVPRRINKSGTPPARLNARSRSDGNEVHDNSPITSGTKKRTTPKRIPTGNSSKVRVQPKKDASPSPRAAGAAARGGQASPRLAVASNAGTSSRNVVAAGGPPRRVHPFLRSNSDNAKPSKLKKRRSRTLSETSAASDGWEGGGGSDGAAAERPPPLPDASLKPEDLVAEVAAEAYAKSYNAASGSPEVVVPVNEADMEAIAAAAAEKYNEGRQSPQTVESVNYALMAAKDAAKKAGKKLQKQKEVVFGDDSAFRARMAAQGKEVK